MSDTETKRRGPVLIEAEGHAETPQDAMPVPEHQGHAMQQVTRIAAYKSSWLSRIFWGGLSMLLGIGVSVAMWDFISDLLARNIYLGQAALGVLGLVGLVLLIVALKEIAAFSRLAKIDALREQVKNADSKPKVESVIKRLNSMYSSREELRWARQMVAEQSGEIIDAPDLLAFTERQMMAPLDAAAMGEVQTAARTVATATALIPIALADIAVALTANIRMVRRIAEVYGGRAGTFGSWRLLRAVATHLLATGAVAIGDDMIGSVVGGGALSKISRKFGEGVINGALTTRVGIAAIVVCRPMPFTALKRPSVAGMLKRSLAGVFQ